MAAQGEYIGLLNFMRGYALATCLLTFTIFTIGTKWYRSLSLTAVWLLFLCLLLVLLLANGVGRGWLEAADVQLVTAGTWLVVGTAFLIFVLAFVRDAVKASPKMMEERQRSAHRASSNRPANRV
jgi:hypothetical protein